MAEFSSIWTVLKQLDYFSGLFLLEKPQVVTWKERIISKSFLFMVINMVIMMITTLVVSKFSLVTVIMATSCTVILLVLCFIAITLKKNRQKVLDFLDWCRDLYDVEKKFHPVLMSIAITNLAAVRVQTLKIIQNVRRFLIIDCIAVSMGSVLIGFLLPDHFNLKYQLPIPFVYPFNSQQTPARFYLGLILQVLVCIIVFNIEVFIFVIFCCIIKHIKMFLNIIQETVRLMKNDLEMKFSLEEDQPQASGNLEPKLTFDEWIKIIVDMVNDVNRIISQLKEFCSFIFLFIETATLGCLFVFGMIFLVVHEHYICGVGVTWYAGLFFVICKTNEDILNQFSLIKDELYDVPWYGMSAKDRKTLLLAMECDNIQNGFHAGNFHHLNMQRFTAVLQIAYKNCIIMRDLINK